MEMIDYTGWMGHVFLMGTPTGGVMMGEVTTMCTLVAAGSGGGVTIARLHISTCVKQSTRCIHTIHTIIIYTE